MIKPLVISAPFGNYHRLLRWVTGADFTPTLGTFTWYPRGMWDTPYGTRLMRLAWTLRYSPIFKSWVNKIGLKNPGIRWYDDRVQAGKENPKDKIISIYGWTMPEWNDLLRVVSGLKPLAVELNLSCPNVDKPPFTYELFDTAIAHGLNVIAKIPPLKYQGIVQMAYEHGVRIFHATNTLSTPNGGMSGKSLMPISLSVVGYLHDHYPDVTIIGGGGITSTVDAVEYLGTGANHVAIGTMLFNPLRWKHVREIQQEVDRTQDLIEDLKGSVL